MALILKNFAIFVQTNFSTSLLTAQNIRLTCIVAPPTPTLHRISEGILQPRAAGMPSLQPPRCKRQDYGRDQTTLCNFFILPH